MGSKGHTLAFRVNLNVILSIAEQSHTILTLTASIIMGVYYIFKYANQLLLGRVTSGVVHVSM